MRDTAICVPVLNEEKLIDSFLKSLATQTAEKKSFFVVLADNGSTDNTATKIREFRQHKPQIHIETCFEKSKGIGPARKQALQVASSLGAKYLLSTDVDSIIPKDFVSQGKKILSKSFLNVLEGKIMFSEYSKLIMILYFKKLMRVMKNISDLNHKLFGPTMYGSYMGLSTKLFQRIYLGDIYDPLIFEEDFMISRRAYLLGANFIKPNNCVFTSDRRIWANTFDWMAHKRVVGKTVKVSTKKTNFVPPSQKDIAKAINIRVNDSSDKIIRTLVDIQFLESLPSLYKYKTNTVLSKACKTLNIPFSELGTVDFPNRFTYLKSLDKKIGVRLRKTVKDYAFR